MVFVRRKDHMSMFAQEPLEEEHITPPAERCHSFFPRRTRPSSSPCSDSFWRAWENESPTHHRWNAPRRSCFTWRKLTRTSTSKVIFFFLWHLESVIVKLNCFRLYFLVMSSLSIYVSMWRAAWGPLWRRKRRTVPRETGMASGPGRTHWSMPWLEEPENLHSMYCISSCLYFQLLSVHDFRWMM